MILAKFSNSYSFMSVVRFLPFPILHSMLDVQCSMFIFFKRTFHVPRRNNKLALMEESPKLASSRNEHNKKMRGGMKPTVNFYELYLKVVFKGKGGVSTGRLLAAVNRPH